jgi:hypothetical protein
VAKGGSSIVESGLKVTPTAANVLPQQRVSVMFQTIIPNAVRNGKLTLSYVPQPRLTPETVSASVQLDGWSLQGPAHLHATLAKTTQLTWDVAHS